jgi:osmotically-inducible protein OsmY
MLGAAGRLMHVSSQEGASMKVLHVRSLRVMSIVALGLPGLVGCRHDSNSTQTTAVTTAPGPEAVVLSDSEIAKAIGRFIREDPAMVGQTPDVMVTEGIASLSGSVANLLAREKAGEIAGTIRGVRSVVNRITVAASARTDGDIKSEVLGVLREDHPDRANALGASVKGGIVTLSGATKTWQEKALLLDECKAVAGVRGVEDAVVFKPAGSPRPQAEIASEVKRRIDNDVWLDGQVFTVAASAGRVKLSGWVGAFGQKLRANADAWVAGVDSVDDDGVLVDWTARDEQRRVLDVPYRTDGQVAQAVRDAFSYDPRLKAAEPEVVVDGCVATLSGNVQGVFARRAAESDAKNTLGVCEVHDQALSPPLRSPPTDADIDRAAKIALSSDHFLPSPGSIGVSTSKGRVALTGSVESGLERLDAEGVVGGVPGVAGVDNQLAVTRSATDVKAAFEDYLYWDAMVRPNRVGIAIAADGTATLTGSLDSWGETRAATHDALRAGARRVVNLIKVKGSPEFAAKH